MSLAPGIRGRLRKKLIEQHRLLKLLEAYEGYIRGVDSPDYLKQRAKKFVQIKKAL